MMLLHHPGTNDVKAYKAIEKLEQETANSNVDTNNKSEIQNKENTNSQTEKEQNTQNINTNISKKSLVIYYSRSGNTKQVADYIGEKTMYNKEEVLKKVDILYNIRYG